MSDSLRVLAVEPFYGGSHRAFLDGVVRHSRHDWQLITGKPVHWKWRMRSAPRQLAAECLRWIDRVGMPDVVFVTDMLDLPTFWGFLRGSGLPERPTVVYFHENQWDYPLSAAARPDLHFGYTNLLTALAADACWFNSAFHQREFSESSRRFVERMPDARQQHDLESLQEKSEVLPPGFDPPDPLPEPCLAAASDTQNHSADAATAIKIGWVSRWEHDKRPDQLQVILSELEGRNIDYRLVLLGPRPADTPRSLREIRRNCRDRILHDGYAETREQYWRVLRSMDFVISTAAHEFFGIAIWEAVWAGAVPVLPDRLSYPEFASGGLLYREPSEAADIIEMASDRSIRRRLCCEAQRGIKHLRMTYTVPQIDRRLQSLVRGDDESSTGLLSSRNQKQE